MAAKKINLLPQELSVGEGYKKVLKAVKMATYTSVGIFVLVVVAGFSADYYFGRNLNNVEEEQSRLETSISEFENVEDKFLLTKYRISKVKNVLSQRENEKVYEKLKILLDNLPPGIELSTMELDSRSSYFELSSVNSRDLRDFMTILTARTDINSLIMNSLSFNAYTGYRIALELY